MQLQLDSQFFMSIVFLGFVGLLCRLYTSLVENPNRLRSKLMKQGISGPPPTILLGNIVDIKKARSTTSNSPSFEIPVSHNCASVILPLFDKWKEQYGMLQSLYIKLLTAASHMITQFEYHEQKKPQAFTFCIKFSIWLGTKLDRNALFNYSPIKGVETNVAQCPKAPRYVKE